MFQILGWPKFFQVLQTTRMVDVRGLAHGQATIAHAIAEKLVLDRRVHTVDYTFKEFVKNEQDLPLQTAYLVEDAGTVLDARLTYKNKYMMNTLTMLRHLGCYVVSTDARSGRAIKVWQDGEQFCNWWISYKWECGIGSPENYVPGMNYWSGNLILLNPRHFAEYEEDQQQAAVATC